MSRGSEFYGIDRTLLRFAGLPGWRAFPYAVQHGWQHAATRFEADASPLEIWAWSERSRDNLAAYFPREQIRVVGSPYLYLDTLDAGDAPDRDALYILPHSSHFARIGFSHGDLHRLLSDVGSTDGGCDVLAYYLDIAPPLCAALEATRSRLLVNGGLWSAGFMPSFRAHVRRYRRVYYSGFGSAVLFARFEGRETAYLALDSRVVASRNVHVARLADGPVYDPVGHDMDTALELGVGHRLTRGAMNALIVEGWRRCPSPELLVHSAKRWRAQIVDYAMRVRPKLSLARAHNARVEVQLGRPSP